MWSESGRKGQAASYKGSFKLNVLMCAEVTQRESMLQERGGGGREGGWGVGEEGEGEGRGGRGREEGDMN